MFRSAAMTLAGAGLALAMTVSTALADRFEVAMIEMRGSPQERPGPFDWLATEPPRTLGDYLAMLDRAKRDDSLHAVVVRLRDAALSMTQIEELAVSMNAVRESGKKVFLFAENYGTAELLLASHADEAIIQAGGAVSFPGLYMEEMYLADTLNWLGVKAQFIQVGDYKGADEQFMNTEPSPAWDENISQLLDSMYANIRDVVKAGRGMTDAQLDEAMKVAWFADAERAIGVGLLDSEVDLAGLAGHLESRLGGDVTWTDRPTRSRTRSRMDTSNPFAIFRMLSQDPKHTPTRETIAVVHIDGPIMDGESSPGGLFGGATTGSRTIRNVLEDLRNDDKVGGVIVRINSPGGSAIASEVIWRGLKRTAEEKPVWVSIGSMAASGGYYIAVGGDRIYTNESSILGSIGVVGGKMTLGGVYEKLKVRVHPRSRGPMADLMSSVEPWTGAQEELVRQRMTETYDLFASRVREGRDGINMRRVGEGRLFTGDRAVALRMADRIGGLDDAVGDLASELGWDRDRFDVMHFPGPKPLSEMFGGAFGITAPQVGVGGEFVSLLKGVVGDAAWNTIRDQLEAMVQVRNEPVLVVLPRAIIIR